MDVEVQTLELRLLMPDLPYAIQVLLKEEYELMVTLQVAYVYLCLDLFPSGCSRQLDDSTTCQLLVLL